ncbi:hypothetical protein ABH940_003493 [Streptacidiphilus sp. BW17]|uniref:ATP-grasp domain-containing protein n=1 Tax=Streptacidiphilus sp. BW17 TaxID=3156274 RepID=UPI0035191230
MKQTTLFINKHEYSWMFDSGRCIVPTDESDIHLLTNWLGGVTGFDARLFPRTTVCDIFDLDEITRLSEWIIEQHGVERVVALHEKMLLLGAGLRTKYGLKGMQYEPALLFRDKIAMKDAVGTAGVRVPAYCVLDKEDDLDKVPWHSGTMVLKDRYGAGAAQIHFVTSPEEARAVWRSLDPAPGQYEIEEFIDGAMFHCDAVILDGRIAFVSVGEYTARPGDYRPGGMAGSYLLPEGTLHERICRLNAQVTTALGIRDGVTHLEVFQTIEDELVFCEIAARPGGGGIEKMNQYAHGIHLIETAIRIEAGLDVDIEESAAASAAVWGRVGFYLDGAPPLGISADRFADLGIVEHKRNEWSGDGNGKPRHGTDYVDKYIVTAPTQAHYLANLEEIRSVYKASR